MSSPTEAGATTNMRTPTINRLRSLFAISERRIVPAIDRMRTLLALNRWLSLFAISGMRGLFGSLDSCGCRVSKSKFGISFSSIRPWVALRVHMVAEVDESTMNPGDQLRAAPPPMLLPISDSPYAPFHLVQTMVEEWCWL